jgi:hypothetical protein
VIIVSETIRRTRQQRCQPGIRAEVHVHLAPLLAVATYPGLAAPIATV